MSLSSSSCTLVVGLSGGPDSTLLLALAAAMQQLEPDEFTVKAVHCVHGLDDDDPYWLAHCRRLCARLGVPLTVKRLDIVYQNRISPEDSSRKERYRALLDVCEQSDEPVLMLGHQRDDKTESFFLALKRGSGPHGLSGMQELVEDERGIIARPLLPYTKAQIEAWLQDLGLSFVFDISNTYLKFERNFLRLKVLPLMRERFPSLDKAVARTQELCALEHDLASRYVDDFFEQNFSARSLSLDFASIDLDDEHLCLMLLRRLAMEKLTQPPELSVLKSALKLLQSSSGRAGLIELNEHYCFKRFADSIRLVRRVAAVKKERHFTLELAPAQQLFVDDYRYRLTRAHPETWNVFFKDYGYGSYRRASPADSDAYIDELFSQVILLPEGVNSIFLHFGLPQSSTRLRPFGRHKSRELKKLFAEFKAPSWQRFYLPAVSFKREISSPEDIIAVDGVFTCHDHVLTIADLKRGLRQGRLYETWIEQHGTRLVELYMNWPDY